jgi:flavodoxin
MNIGIILHSHTGNTLSVAEKLQSALLAAGHSVTLERVTADGPQPPQGNAEIKLLTAPDPSPYDFLIFAAPVWGFSLSTVMKKYLEGLPSLKGKKAGVFVTHRLSPAFLGGNHAAGQLKKACEAKGLAVQKTGVISWDDKKREKDIEKLIAEFARM